MINVLDNADCKIKTKYTNLHRWKSWEPQTPFAPSFDLPIWVEDLNPFFIKSLIEDVGKEKIGSYLSSWRNYNIFKWDSPSVTFLKSSITRVYSEYLNSLEYDKERLDDLWIRGWAVVLEPGEAVPVHCHSWHQNTFISGTLMLSDNKTTTDFFIPHLSNYYGPWKCENKPGRMAMFPSWVMHKVDSCDSRRVSIGFDMFSFHTLEYISNNRIAGDEQQECILKSVKLV